MPVELSDLDDNKKRIELRKVLRRIATIAIPEHYYATFGDDSLEILSASHVPVLVEMFQTLARCDFYFLPDAEVEKLTHFADQTIELYNRTQVENVSKQERDNILRASEELYTTSFFPVSTVIAYWTAKETDVEGQKKQTEGIVEQLKETQKEAEKILQQIKETTQKATVEKEAIHFKEEAERHRMGAYAWLGVSSVIALITFWFAWDNYSFYTQLPMKDEMGGSAMLTTAQSIQLGVAKLFLFSFLVGGIVWSGRVYRAHRHNYVVNKHRQNALSTFKTFVSSTQDQQTKNAVLLQATQCVFAPQATGYITQDNEAGGTPQILEIVRGISEGSKS